MGELPLLSPQAAGVRCRAEQICDAEPPPAPTLTFTGALRRKAPFWGRAYLLPGLLQMLIVPNHVWQIQENKFIAVLRAKIGIFFPHRHPIDNTAIVNKHFLRPGAV